MSEKWSYDESSKMFVCNECGKKLKTPGGVNLHYNRVHKNGKKESKQKGCTHENLRLLNSGNALDSKAIIAGYYAVCETCDELLKEGDL